ncbi:15-hydroxyprostaglandin dehydrogenase [NAD+] [Papilio machaon]|uniref:15-hydroxyprostaglandin dehydrogenase [NAD(+)] n=1 Tax=Papilio machaon TaxID=76193 RepID=A0A0N1IPZ2_PAPMA|nr:15-hydroxyprostaglandin dehydrogenase [NAD+] [Papilio machaon]
MAAKWEPKNKNILITGAASGLGAAYAEALLKEGAKNIAVLDIDVKTGENFVSKLNETYNNKAIFIKCDVSKEEDIKNSFNIVLNKFKRIDLLINNAGIMSDTDSMWRLACDVNWQGLVSFTMKAVKHMRKDEGGDGGTIVNISSTAGICKLNFLPIYCGSKGAVLHFSQSLAVCIPLMYNLLHTRSALGKCRYQKKATIDKLLCFLPTSKRRRVSIRMCLS